MATSRLHQLSELGQSVWIDSLSREMLETGELARLMQEDAVVGVTSNPTIFEKALSSGGWYDEQLREVLEHENDPKEVFIALATEDIRDACDLLRGAWERSEGVDGRVSIEVDPDLAYDRDASYREALRLHELVDRPNAYVKIPGTARGRECEARVPELQAHLFRRALGPAREPGRQPAALPLGLDFDEESRLQRRPLRRPAHRPGDREHDAARDDRGVSGSRHRRG